MIDGTGVGGRWGFSRTVSCVPVVLKRRYCLRISFTISKLCAISPPLFTSDCRFLTVTVSGSNLGRWRRPSARGGKRSQIRPGRRAASYIHAGPRVRAVDTWFCCDDLARSCSLHIAAWVGLQLVYYQLSHAPVSLVMVEECRCRHNNNRC